MYTTAKGSSATIAALDGFDVGRGCGCVGEICTGGVAVNGVDGEPLQPPMNSKLRAPSFPAGVKHFIDEVPASFERRRYTRCRSGRKSIATWWCDGISLDGLPDKSTVTKRIYGMVAAIMVIAATLVYCEVREPTYNMWILGSRR